MVTYFQKFIKTQSSGAVQASSSSATAFNLSSPAIRVPADRRMKLAASPNFRLAIGKRIAILGEPKPDVRPPNLLTFNHHILGRIIHPKNWVRQQMTPNRKVTENFNASPAPLAPTTISTQHSQLDKKRPFRQGPIDLCKSLFTHFFSCDT